MGIDTGTRLEFFDERGHWPQHERHELCNPLSIHFLNRHPMRGRAGQ